MSIKKEWKEKITTEWQPDFVISSGSVILDQSPALKDFKGIPAGAIVQIASDKEGSFKSSMALQSASNIQKELGKKIVLIDAEAGVTGLQWVEKLGVLTDPDHWIYYQPETGEEALEMADWFLKQDDIAGVIVDSIDACVPQTQMENELGDADIGNHAKLVTRAVRKFRSTTRVNQSIIWLINQKKVNLTAMGAMGTKTTGGRGINFYSKLNIELARDKSPAQLEGSDIIPLRMTIKKSKFGDSFITLNTFAKQGYGIDAGSELALIAEQKGILTKAASWWKYEGDAIGQGITAAREWSLKNKDLILND